MLSFYFLYFEDKVQLRTSISNCLEGFDMIRMCFPSVSKVLLRRSNSDYLEGFHSMLDTIKTCFLSLVNYNHMAVSISPRNCWLIPPLSPTPTPSTVLCLRSPGLAGLGHKNQMTKRAINLCAVPSLPFKLWPPKMNGAVSLFEDRYWHDIFPTRPPLRHLELPPHLLVVSIWKCPKC